MKRKNTVHVISGTHWDREWRFTAEQSKLRLADLLDNLIDLMEKNPDYEYFLLDGGTVILEDYESVRPENMNRLKRLIEKGKIHLVNFYTLPDMFIVAPEAIIRNLLIGQRVGARGGGCMKFGYTATSYGQTSQLPQIYRGFGIETIMFYRGANKYMPPCFKWEGADGSQILAFRCFDIVTRTNWFFYVHQPLVLNKQPKNLEYHFNPEEQPVHPADESGYQQDFHLMNEKYQFNRDTESLKQAYRYFMEVSEADAIGSHILGLNMEDNQKPFELIARMIDAINAVQSESWFKQNSLDKYYEEILEELDKSKLNVVKGEIRRTAVEIGFNALLGAVLSSRVNIKLLNERAETDLIYFAEPLASLASIYGARYPNLNLETAWKSLLQNHAHDSICGSAIEQAHKDMVYRFSETRMISEEITRRSLESLWRRISFNATTQGDLTLTFFNTLSYHREEIVPAIVDIPLDLKLPYFDIFDINGNEIPYEVVWSEEIDMRCERELDTNAITFPSKRHYIVIPVKTPPMGYSSYVIRLREPRYVPNPEPVGDRALIATPDTCLENQFLKLSVNPNGTFNLLHKESGKTFKDLHYFTDSGEVGHAHITRKPVRDFTVSSKGVHAGITVVESNPLRGTIKIEIAMKVPAEADFDGRDRSHHLETLDITSLVSLTKGSKRIDIVTKINNRARDHRVRVNFPTDIRTDFSSAESAFAVEKRSLIWQDTGDNFEPFFPYQPMQNFVDISDGETGFAFLNRGIREYEVIDDARRTLAVTLLRTHRSYMTANEKMTPSELAQYEGSHVPGEIEFHYALYPHKGGWQEAEILRHAYMFKAPLKILQGTLKKEGDLPAEYSFLDIDPAAHIHLAALKQAEDGKGYILRLWNASQESIISKIHFNLPIKEVERVDLREKISRPLEVNNGRLEMKFNPSEILTLKIQC